MIGLLLLALQEASLPEGYEIEVGPFFDGTSFRYVARESEGSGKIAVIGAKRHDASGGIVITDGKSALEFVTVYDRVENAQYANGELVSYEAVDGKKRFIVLRTERFELPEGRTVYEKSGSFCVLPRGQEKFSVVGEKFRGGEYDSIHSLRVSPDGKSVIYRAKLGAEDLLLHDQRRISGPNYSDWGFSPSGEPYYLTWTKTKEGGQGDLILSVGTKSGIRLKGTLSELRWTPDGRTPILKMIQMREGKTLGYYVLGSRVFRSRPSVDGAVPSPDGKNLAYYGTVDAPGGGQRAQKFTSYVNDVLGAEFDEIALQTWRPDSSRMVYAARSGMDWFMVDGGTRIGQWDGIRWAGVHPRSGAIACVALKGGSWQVVHGDEVSPKFLGVGAIRFGADGKLWYDAEDMGKHYLLRGSETLATSEAPIPHLGHGVWRVTTNDRKVELIFEDGKVGPFDAVPIVVTGGKVLVFVGAVEKKETAYVGRKPVQKADRIYEVRLIEGGKVVQILSRTGRTLRITKVPFDPPKEK